MDEPTRSATSWRQETSMSALAEPAIARHVVRQVRGQWPGWRIFLTDTGRWQATTLRRPAVIPADHWQPRHTVMCPDAVDADEYRELAAKLTERTTQ